MVLVNKSKNKQNTSVPTSLQQESNKSQNNLLNRGYQKPAVDNYRNFSKCLTNENYKGCEIFIRKIKQKIRKNIKEYKQKKQKKNR